MVLSLQSCSLVGMGKLWITKIVFACYGFMAK